MSLATIMTADFQVIRADDLQPVTIGGVTKNAIVGELTRSKEDMQAGGYLPANTVQIELLRSDWATAPTVGGTLTCAKFSGITFAIKEILDPPISTYWFLTCWAKQDR